MMKRLLFCAVSALFAFSANAVEVGDYVYTPSGRYQLTAPTSINLSLNEEFDGWTSISDDALPDNFAVVDGYVSATDAANTKGLYKSFTVDSNDKTYVLVFNAKANEDVRAYSFTPKFLGTVQDYIAHLNVYATESGEYVSTATAEATVSAQADLGLGFQLTGEYQTYATAFTNGGSDQTWFIEMSQLLGGISVGNIQVFEAQQVYDNRFIQNKIAYINAIKNVYDWDGMQKTPEEQNVWDGFKGLSEELEDMADNTSVDDGAAKIEEVDGKIAEFVTTFFGDYAADQGIRLQDGAAVTKKSDPVAGWATTQRWWHTKGNADLYWGNYAYTYANSNTITQTKTLAPGSYVFAVDAFMDMMAKKGTIINHSYGYYSPDTRAAVCRGQLTLSILDGTDEKFVGQTIALDDEVYQTGVVAFSIPEGQEGEYTFKIFGNDTYDGTVGAGGNGNLQNLRIYFKPFGKYTAKQLAYIEKVRTQITAMRDAYDKSVSYYTDPEGKYYWYKWAVQDTSAIYQPYLEFYEGLTDDDIIAGFDDPASKAAKEAAETEAGQEFPDWDYNLAFDKYDAGIQNAADSLTNRAVRPMLRLNERFLSYNQVLFDMLESIDKAKIILDTRVFSGRIAYATLEGAVGDAEAMFEDYKEDPGTVEDLVDSYIPAVQEITNQMNETMTNFYQSGYNAGEEPTIIRSFDFENADAFTLEDPATDPGAGSYTDETGAMAFTNLELGTETGSTAITYCNGWLTEGAWANQGSLRVGSGDGTIALEGDDIVSGTDALHVSLDFYYGNLSGKSAGFYLKDAEGTNVAGLWGSKYNGDWLSTAYNPFQIDGNKDISGVGSSSASNDAIVAETNKTTFDIYIDYGTKTMFCILNNAKQGVINKRFDAEMENQNPVAAVVLNSNYNNQARRCWADNILIEKIPLPTPAGYYSVKIAEGIENGKIQVSGSAKAGEEVTIKAIPAEGYELSSVSVTGVHTDVAVEVTNGKFIMPEDDVTVNAEFSLMGVKGDVNGDGIVNGTDIQAVINFIVAGEYDSKADVNEDGKVNGTDIQEIINIIVSQD